MERRTFVMAGGALLGLCPGVRGQGTPKPRRIGFLAMYSRANAESFLALLRPELEQLGWSDGRNIVFLEPRTALRAPPDAMKRVAMTRSQRDPGIWGASE
jgi:hypothetical protein